MATVYIKMINEWYKIHYDYKLFLDCKVEVYIYMVSFKL